MRLLLPCSDTVFTDDFLVNVDARWMVLFFSRGKLQSCFVFLFHLQSIILSSLCPFSIKRHFLLEVESISCFLSWALCGVILEERSSKCNLAAISVELVPCVVPPKNCKKKSSNRGEIWFALLNWKETFTDSLVFFYKFLSKTYWDTWYVCTGWCKKPNCNKRHLA